MKTKSVIFIVIALAFCFSLVACNGAIKRKDAKELTEAFVSAVASGDFEKAASYLHPEKPLNLEKYFNDIEARAGIDFQKGIEIKRYTGFSTSLYDSEVDGADYELEMNIIVDGVAFELAIEIVKNDLGYGIYDIELDR